MGCSPRATCLYCYVCRSVCGWGGLCAMVCAGLADRASVPWPLLAGGESGCAGVGSLKPWWARLLCGIRESGADERTPVPPALGGVGGADKIQRNATTRKSVVGRKRAFVQHPQFLKMHTTHNLHLVSGLLDSVGPEASLGHEAWARIAALDLTTSHGIRVLTKEYLLPDFKSSPARLQQQVLDSLKQLLAAEEVLLERQIVQEYPYMERTPPRLLFSILAEELMQNEVP